MVETFTEVAHPNDATYQLRRQKIVDDLLRMNSAQLDRQLRLMLQQPPQARDDSGETTKNILRELRTASFVPDTLKGILDSTSGTTGNVLIRQDLEPTLYALFVKVFPAFERLQKGPSNGLVHAANQITTPDSGSLGSTILATEVSSVSYAASTYVRQTYPIAIFATGRGVSFKELAAVAQGGAPYDPQKTELANGMVKLATDVQYTLFQGNATNSSGTGSQEAGLYNANAFDGFRGVFGSAGSFSSNNAIQADVSTLNMLESIQFVAAKAANNGGMPSAVFMSMNSKQALDTEQQSNQRYNDANTEIIPGVRVNSIMWANGSLAIIPVPGNMIGTYNRTSDSALVEDIYVVDESTVTIRWLFSPSFTVLQIPSGVDGILSERYIIFAMYGMELPAPLFNGKVRRLAS